MKKRLLSAFVAVACCMVGWGWAVQGQGKVDINKASSAELDTLPGIGPAIAGRIIEFRTKNGPFKRPEDLMNVRGIGEKKFLKLKDRISVSGGTAAAGAQPKSKPAVTTPPKK